MTGLATKMTELTSALSSEREIPFAAPETTAKYHDGVNNGLTKLAPALVKAQSELKNATLNKVNPHFKSRYADLAEIRDTVTPALSKNGLAIIHFTQLTGSGFFLVTRLLHESGEFIDSRYPLPENIDRPQQMGSAITYARRYMLAAMCGITADEDDDGNAAQASSNGGGQRNTVSGSGKTATKTKSDSKENSSGGDGIIF